MRVVFGLECHYHGLPKDNPNTVFIKAINFEANEGLSSEK